MGAASPDRPPIGTLVAYAVPSAAFSFALFYVQFYFLKFATDVLLLAPAAVGALLGAGRIWDAVSDPLAGHWSDRTRSRLGRRRGAVLPGIEYRMHVVSSGTRERAQSGRSEPALCINVDII